MESSEAERQQEIEFRSKRAVERLRYWQSGGTSFACELYSLMQKADPTNFAILANAYPFEACALIAWRHAPDPAQFFRNHGVGG